MYRMAESTRRVWVCEITGCGHVWIAASTVAPEKCAKCRSRAWHVTKTTVELIRESGASLDGKIEEIADRVARRVFAEEWARVPAEVTPMAEPEILPPGPVNMAVLRDICAGNVPNVARNVPGGGYNVPAPLATPMEPSHAPLVREPCSYTEWDEQLGETFRCGLMAHSPKVKHTRGAKV